MPTDYSNIIGRKPYRPFTSYIPSDYLSRTFDRRGNLNSVDIVSPNSFDPLNPDIDLIWSGKSTDELKFNSYYDYYFTGEDVRIYIDGLFDAGQELDIANFAFMIKQEKQPVYGFWSYNYDVMMMGTRIIAGEFSIYSRYPGRMRDLLSAAAKQRVAFNKGEQGARIESWLLSRAESNEDEKNIEKYWANSSLDRLSSDTNTSNDRNIFSAHPPFNFIIKYGTQEGSVTTKGRNGGTGGEDNFDTLDRIMATDYNERLVQKNSSDSMNIVLQSIHLTNMATSYVPGGQALIETYQFMARDMYISEGSIRDSLQSSETVASSASSGHSGTDPSVVQPTPSEQDVKNIYNQYGKSKYDEIMKKLKELGL